MCRYICTCDYLAVCVCFVLILRCVCARVCSCTQVCLVAFTKGKMQVLASAFDRNLGGRDIDMSILNHFAVQWKEKKKLNLLENPKAVLRLLAAIDKV